MKRIISAVVAIALTSCGGPQPLAEKHLSLIKYGKIVEAQKQYCDAALTPTLNNLKSFKIVSTKERKSNKQYPYTEVIASIETTQDRSVEVETVPGVKSTKLEPITQAIVRVWKADDFYQNTVFVNAKLNELSKGTEALTGVAFKENPMPSRDTVAKDGLCVDVAFEAFGD